MWWLPVLNIIRVGLSNAATSRILVSLIVKWLTRVASLHIIAPGRSVMLPEVAGYGPCVSVPSPDEDTWENNTTKRALQYARWLKTLKLAGYIYLYTYPHSFTPPASKASIPQRCGRDDTKEMASLASIRLRRVIMAPNRKVASWQYGKRGIFVCGDVRIQDGDADDLVKLGGGGGGGAFLHLFLLSFNRCSCASVCSHRVHV